jgi:hypothetical protein
MQVNLEPRTPPPKRSAERKVSFCYGIAPGRGRAEARRHAGQPARRRADEGGRRVDGGGAVILDRPCQLSFAGVLLDDAVKTVVLDRPCLSRR